MAYGVQTALSGQNTNLPEWSTNETDGGWLHSWCKRHKTRYVCIKNATTMPMYALHDSGSLFKAR